MQSPGPESASFAKPHRSLPDTSRRAGSASLLSSSASAATTPSRPASRRMAFPPRGHDPARNRHRDKRRWSKLVVHSIPMNPRCTARHVWKPQRRDEVLVDVKEVLASSESRLQWNAKGEWAWSSEVTHQPIIAPRTSRRPRRRSPRPGDPTPRGTTTTGTHIRSGMCINPCGHRMHGAEVTGL